MTFDLLNSVIYVGYYAIIVGTILLVLMRKSEPEAALPWILSIVLLPVVGSVFFLLVGVKKIPRRLRKKVSHKSEFNEKFSQQDPGAIQPLLPSKTPLDPQRARWTSIGCIAEKLADSQRRDGNTVQVFEYGEAAFDAIFAAIEAARDHVHIEKFIFRHDDLGKHLVDLLIKKIKDGVEVRVLIDAFGSLGAWTLVRRLRNAGGRAEVFMPLLPLYKRFTPNLRNHRKIVVCDGHTGFFGGLNIGDEYLGAPKYRSEHWCDAHIKVTGPVVLDLQKVFAEDWDFATGEFLSDDRYFRDIPSSGSASVQVVSSGPDSEVNAIRQIYFAAIGAARESLFLASPYVVPDLGMRDAIISAALRGIKVSLLTQGNPPDYWIPHLASSYFWEDYLSAGVRIFRYQPGMMHAKIIVVDDAWASVGSANLDNRSLSLNFELIGLFDRKEEVAAIVNWFTHKIALSTEVTLDAFSRRSVFRRIAERGTLLLAPLL